MLDKQTIYRRSIIKHLYFTSPLSCADLSLLTEKSVPLTARVLNELIEEGYVLETGLASSSGGRRPQMYSLQTNLMYVVSVAVDQLITRIAMMDMQNNYVGEVEKLELVLSNDPSVLEELAAHIDAYITRSGITKDKIAGIGIGMPGFVDVKKGINHSFLKVKEGSIVTYIESVTGLPVLIDNDSSLVALAEFKLGMAKGKKNVMVLNIGWGIGLGMILDGALFRGDNGFSGEFSHIPLFTNNKICSCGKMGCLETETSLLVIAQKAINGLQQGKLSILKDLTLDHVEDTARLILEAALRGDKFAIEIISEAGYNIGRGLAILVHLLNPGTIVLSGRGSIGGKLWLAPVQQALNEHCIPKIAENLEVRISSLGYQAELVGAAALVMEQFDQIKQPHQLNGVKNILA